MSAALPIGALRQLITLEAPNDALDDNGGVVRTYAAVTTIHARILPKNVDMIFQGDSQDENVTHEIMFRSWPGLKGDMRFRLGTRVFQILGFDDFDEKGITTRALCQEIRP